MKISIIIPVYNEVKTIDHMLRLVDKERIAGYQKEIIVVNDGSTDGTDVILNAWKSKCKVITQPVNSGKGSAVTKGFEYVTGDIILIQDADMEYPPSNYPVLLKPFESNSVNVVYGSRFLGAHLSTMFVYAQGNKFVTFISNILYNTNITDMETGYKVFRTSVIKNMKIYAKRFDFEPEFTAKILKKGFQIYEVPIAYYGRKFSEGKKLTWKDGVVALFVLLKYRIFN